MIRHESQIVVVEEHPASDERISRSPRQIAGFADGPGDHDGHEAIELAAVAQLLVTDGVEKAAKKDQEEEMKVGQWLKTQLPCCHKHPLK